MLTITVKDADAKSIYFNNPGARLELSGSTANVTIEREPYPEEAKSKEKPRLIIGSFPNYISAIVVDDGIKPPKAKA